MTDRKGDALLRNTGIIFSHYKERIETETEKYRIRNSRSDRQTGKEDRCFSVGTGYLFVSYVYFHAESLDTDKGLLFFA
jgi:hypothetical protein